MKKRFAGYAILAITSCMVACSVSDGTLNSGEKGLKALESKGVPDSSLSVIRVKLYEAREAKRRGENGTSRLAAKQMRFELAKAEENYRNNIASLKPSVDSLRAIIASVRNNYTGRQLRLLDSLTAKVDSFIAIDWQLQAYVKASEITGSLKERTADEERSIELTAVVPGQWLCENVTKGTDNKDINAIEKKTFILEKDGSGKFIETKKGQSGPYLKEDWEFNSWGTWEIGGDTIFLKVNKFSSVRQNFERLFIENGGKKKTWKKEPQPTYDSTITDGSQDRYIAFTDLKQDFKQIKKY